MHIGIVYIGDNKTLEEYKNIFVKGLEAKNHRVREISESELSPRVAGMKHLVFFIDSGSLFSKKYLNRLQNFVKKCGIMTAHFASVFVQARPLVNGIFLKYMKEVEHQGLIIHYSDILQGAEHVEDILKTFEPTTH